MEKASASDSEIDFHFIIHSEIESPFHHDSEIEKTLASDSEIEVFPLNRPQEQMRLEGSEEDFFHL